MPSEKEVIDRIIEEAQDIVERFHSLSATSSQKC